MVQTSSLQDLLVQTDRHIDILSLLYLNSVHISVNIQALIKYVKGNATHNWYKVLVIIFFFNITVFNQNHSRKCLICVKPL